MASSITAQYAAGVAAGRVGSDDAQLAVIEKLATARGADRRASPGAQILVARLAVRQPQGAAAQGPLHLRRRRPRQDHADGFVLRSKSGGAQAPRAFSRIHARRARTHFRAAPEDEARRARRRRSDPACRRAIARRGLAALLRRIPRHRHRRRHDFGPAVRAIVRARRRGRRHLERGAGRALQGRLEPRAVRAVHPPARRAHGRHAARCAHRFSAGETRRPPGVVCAGRRRGRRRARRHLAAAHRRQRRRARRSCRSRDAACTCRAPSWGWRAFRSTIFARRRLPPPTICASRTNITPSSSTMSR